MDPLGVDELTRTTRYGKLWEKYTDRYNAVRKAKTAFFVKIPTVYELQHVRHERQTDNRTCGIWVMLVGI